jgi:hypothetical protein
MFDNKTFFQYLFQLFAYTVTAWLLLDLLFKCLHSRWFLRLSTCLLINIIIWTLTSIGAIFLNTYLLLFMGREKSGLFFDRKSFLNVNSQIPTFLGPIMFLANVICGNLLYMCYISTMLLMVERICALTCPIIYKRHYKFLVIGKIVICFIGGLIYSGTTFVEWPVEQVTSKFLNCDEFCSFIKREMWHLW